MNPAGVLIAVGANLGERESVIRSALAELEATEQIEVVAVSPLVDSVAITLDGADATKPAYLNGVARLVTTLDPESLLEVLLAVESRFGRVREERWGDRTLDLDIVDWTGLELDTPRLTLPHPRAAERDFVLAPWLAIEPDAVLTGVGPVASLLAALHDGSRP